MEIQEQIENLAEYNKFLILVTNWINKKIKIHKKDKGCNKFSEEQAALVQKIFYGFTEIQDSYESLELAEILISRNPPKSKLVRNDKYIRFIINSYLNEMYILRERVTIYYKHLKRIYHKTPNRLNFEENTNSINATIDGIFTNISAIRGKHVHEDRFSDQDLDRFSITYVIANTKEEFCGDVEFEYMLAKSKWKKIIHNNNQEIMKFLNSYFGNVYKGITKNGKILEF